MEIEKINFSWHVALRTFIQIHEKWPPTLKNGLAVFLQSTIRLI